MRTEITVSCEEPVITLGTDLVYSQKTYWCNAAFYPLKMSVLRPRCFFEYDKKPSPMPVILWLCGGGWTEVEQNVWMPELTYFAKHGYFVASISYSLSPTWFFPEPLVDTKQAVRFLRAHAEEFNIDPNRIAIMGESAGAHFAALAAVTNGIKDFERGDNLEYSSDVQACVTWYAPVDMADMEGRGELESYDTKPQFLMRGLEFEPQSLCAGVEHVRKHKEINEAMDPRSYIGRNTPPFLLLHGDSDTQVSSYHSEVLYEALQKNGVDSDLIIVRGADHADIPFVQKEMKDRILAFLNSHM